MCPIRPIFLAVALYPLTSGLTENGPDQLRLVPYGNRFLQFADGISLRPSPESFRKHREFHGIASS